MQPVVASLELAQWLHTQPVSYATTVPTAQPVDFTDFMYGTDAMSAPPILSALTVAVQGTSIDNPMMATRGTHLTLHGLASCHPIPLLYHELHYMQLNEQGNHPTMSVQIT